MNSTSIHLFEKKGLGTAPFRFRGVISFPYPSLAESNVDAYNRACREAGERLHTLGITGGICDYCGMAIMNNYVIQSADGRYSVVGSSCIEKHGSEGLRKAIAPAKRKAQTQRRHDREAKKVAQARQWLTDPEIQDRLSAEPHPLEWRAQQGDTRLEWCHWMLNHGGMQASAKVYTYINSKRRP